jgi:hypothetical protein
MKTRYLYLATLVIALCQATLTVADTPAEVNLKVYNEGRAYDFEEFVPIVLEVQNLTRDRIQIVDFANLRADIQGSLHRLPPTTLQSPEDEYHLVYTVRSPSGPHYGKRQKAFRRTFGVDPGANVLFKTELNPSAFTYGPNQLTVTIYRGTHILQTSPVLTIVVRGDPPPIHAPATQPAGERR